MKSISLSTLQSDSAVVYATGLPLVVPTPNPLGLPLLAPHLTSCGGIGPTTLICQRDPHLQRLLPREHHHHTVYTTKIYEWLTHDTVVYTRTGVVVAS